MRLRKIVVVGAAVLIGLPILLLVLAAAAFYAFFYFPTPATALSRTLESAAQRRQYLLYVPKTYDPTKPTPLVISLHPAMSWPSSQMAISGWNRVADEHGFIVAYPAGSGLGPKTWFMEGQQHPSQMPDVQFISNLIDTLEAAYNIDPTRIYADGMSNGAGMAFALSCTLSDRIAAIGAVSAAESLTWSWCRDTTPMPMICFHGTADPVAPYNGANRSWLNPKPLPGVRMWVAEWARRNHCAPVPRNTATASDVTRTEYLHCAQGATVVLYTIRGGGHQWPGGKALPRFIVGRYTRSVDATREEWAFFARHRLPGR